VQDTTPPGTPTGVRVEDGDLRWGAVGDDLMCEGGPVVYETATSAQPITGDTFDDARKFEAPASRAVGDQQSVALPSDVERYVAVRAADDAGNLGRTVAVDLRPPAGGGGGGTGTGTGTGGAVGGGGPVGGPGGGTTAQPPGNRPSGGGGGEASTCVPTRLLRRATVRPRGRSLGVVVPEAAAPVTVDVFQQSVGRRLGDRLVARFRARRTSFVWNGRANLRGRRVRDGYLFVRFRAGGETKRFALRRRRRGFAVRPRYYEPALCRVLASAKLLRPVFGGRSNRALSVSFHLTEQARVAIAVTRGRRVVRRFAARTYPPNRTFRLRVASRRRGDHRVRIVATAGARTDRVTLVSRRL
jgi:hypothetical protein